MRVNPIMEQEMRQQIKELEEKYWYDPAMMLQETGKIGMMYGIAMRHYVDFSALISTDKKSI